MCFLAISLSMLQLVSASAPLHLKPGALTTHLGEVALIEDTLLVRYPFSALFSVPTELDIVSNTLNNSLQTLNSMLANETHGQTQTFSQIIIKVLKARVEFLHERLNQSKHDYNLHPVHARTKRQLINGFGKLSQYLFGTAMDEDVQDMREHS